MKKISKLLSIILTLIIVISNIPMSNIVASAATDIESLTITPSRPLYVGLDEWYGVIDYTLDIVYKDGRCEKFVYDVRNFVWGGDLYFEQSVPLEIGTYKVPISYQGYTTDCVIQVKENPYNKLTISSENGLTLYFTKKDGSIVKAQPYDMYAGRGDSDCAFCELYTDNGNFRAEFHFESYNSNKNVKLVIGSLESNVLEKNDWFKAETFCEEMINPVQESFSIPYNGEITEENIDEIIGMITVHFPISEEGHINYGDMEADMLNGEEIRQAIAYVFGIENVDLSLSKKYDSSTDTVLFFGGGIGRLLPSTIEYVDNTWVFRRYGDLWSSESVWQMVLNDDLKIISVNWCDKKENHVFSDWTVTKHPTCTETGLMINSCLCCGTEESQSIQAIGHEDADVDAYCDNCDELLCNHNCHKGGIAGFFWKITNFFNRIFGSNKVCDCGVAHY